MVKSRCHDVIAAQFTALAHHCRNNYIGQTGAFFRQMALTSGMHVNPNINNGNDHKEEDEQYSENEKGEGNNDDDNENENDDINDAANKGK